MAEIINCPECERTVSVPERLLGKTVRCPACKATFIAESAVQELEVIEDDEPPRSPARKPARRAADHQEERRRQRRRDEEDEDARPRHSRRRSADERDDDEDDELEDDRPRRRKRPRFRDANAQAWEKVQLGLVLVMSGFVVAFVANVVMAIWSYSGAASGFQAGPRPGGGAPDTSSHTIVGAIYLLCALVSAGLTIAGDAVCLAIPKDKNARSTAISSIAMLILGLLLYLGGSVTFYIQLNSWNESLGAAADPTAPPTFGLVIVIGGFALLLGQPVVFLLFLRAAAITTRKGGLALAIITQVIFGALAVLIFIVGAMSGYSALRGVIDRRYIGGGGGIEEAASIGRICAYVAFFSFVAFAVWNIATIILTRLAISDHIRRIE